MKKPRCKGTIFSDFIKYLLAKICFPRYKKTK